MSRILVIDDDLSIRYALQILLGNNGHEVVQAANGQTGRHLIESVAFDAAIIDMFMDGMDGFATVRELHRHDPNLPFIVLSNHAFTEQRTGTPDFLGMAVRLGAVAALQKPFPIFELLNALEKCLRLRARGESPSPAAHPAMRSDQSSHAR